MTLWKDLEPVNGNTPRLAPYAAEKGLVLKVNKDRNRRPLKLSKPEIARALEISEANQRASDEIRKRHGLALVPERETVTLWRAAVGSWRATPKGPVRVAPVVDQTLSGRAEALKAAREKVARAQAKVDRETAQIAAEVKGTREVSKVAAVLGLSRQRLYQLAA